MRLRGIAGAVLALALMGCSSSSGAGSGPAADSGADVATVDDTGAPAFDGGFDGPAPDAGAGDAAADAAYPAFMPAMPQLQKGTLSVMAAPVVVPVYFSGEDATLESALDTFLSGWLASTAFTDAVKEYGITSATAGTAIQLTETAGTTLTSSAIETWLDGKLNTADPAWGPVDATTLASKVFVLFYPSTTTITYGTSTSCSGFGAYHLGTGLTSTAVASYIVVPRCAPGMGQTQTDALTTALSTMVVSAATDPVQSMTFTATGWAGFDTAHASFDALGEEVGTACAQLPAVTPAGVSQAISRSWSNAAAAAYHDPCLPAAAGAYYVAVPIATDSVTVDSLATTGALVPVGTKRTFDVQLLSDGPTGGPWNLKAFSTTGSSSFTYALDANTGSNGDVLHLTITAPATASTDVVLLISGPSGAPRSYWPLAVQAQ